MTMRVVLDTSLLVGLLDSRDKWHSQAVAIRDALQAVGAAVVFVDPVVNEVVSVLARRMEEQQRTEQFTVALTRLESLISPDMVTWISASTEQLYGQVLALVREHEGRLNFHDALIALACRELEIEHLAGFDRDFDRVDWLVRIGDADAILSDR